MKNFKKEFFYSLIVFFSLTVNAMEKKEEVSYGTIKLSNLTKEDKIDLAYIFVNLAYQNQTTEKSVNLVPFTLLYKDIKKSEGKVIFENIEKFYENHGGNFDYYGSIKLGLSFTQNLPSSVTLFFNNQHCNSYPLAEIVAKYKKNFKREELLNRAIKAQLQCLSFEKFNGEKQLSSYEIKNIGIIERIFQ